MPKQIIYLIVAAIVIGFLVVSFILICCVYALGKSNHRKEFDKEQETELKGISGEEG